MKEMCQDRWGFFRETSDHRLVPNPIVLNIRYLLIFLGRNSLIRVFAILCLTWMFAWKSYL